MYFNFDFIRCLDVSFHQVTVPDGASGLYQRNFGSHNTAEASGTRARGTPIRQTFANLTENTVEHGAH